MNKTNSLYCVYYAGLSLATVIAVVMTLTQAGGSVFTAQKFHQLEQQKKSMVQHKQALTLAVAQQTSLAQVAEQANASGFQPITQPLSLSVTTVMAAR